MVKHFPSSDELIVAALEIQAEASREKIRSALLGGLAMQFYGSDRLTKDVDFVADGPLEGRKSKKTLTFGGDVYETKGDIDVDWIVRNDYQEDLYLEALDNAIAMPLEDQADVLIVSAHYLAAIKFAARREKDHGDLLRLLMAPDVVDTKKALDIVERHLGGYAKEEFQAAINEAEWRRSEEK